jgi:hypothetical protein
MRMSPTVSGMRLQGSRGDNRIPAETSSVPTALVLNPRNDAAFVAFAEGALATGVTTPGALQERLRERYPLAVVRERALSSEPFTIWYCYRDGRWIRP